jgi:hypothetical protein
MNADEKVYPSGQHYSGTNRIPNIKQFVESLDRQKKQRDAQVDAQLRAGSGHGEAQDHVSATQQQQQKSPAGKNRRTVRDPVTGRDVEIEDIDTHHMKAADQPMVGKTPPSLQGTFPLACGWALVKTKGRLQSNKN